MHLFTACVHLQPIQPAPLVAAGYNLTAVRFFGMSGGGDAVNAVEISTSLDGSKWAVAHDALSLKGYDYNALMRVGVIVPIDRGTARHVRFRIFTSQRHVKIDMREIQVNALRANSMANFPQTRHLSRPL